MIEHFSPYCGHCKAFAPTWKKLVQHYEEMDDPGVHLAQIDCAANGGMHDHSVDSKRKLKCLKTFAMNMA